MQQFIAGYEFAAVGFAAIALTVIIAYFDITRKNKKQKAKE